jgi:alpha-glucosidase (family GH31 glycosyl hydrolase)
MLADWKKDGVRPMVYMNPYYANLTGNPDIKNNLFEELDSKGYLIKDSNNKTYELKSVSIQFGMLDFTNEAARNWTKD